MKISKRWFAIKLFHREEIIDIEFRVQFYKKIKIYTIAYLESGCFILGGKEDGYKSGYKRNRAVNFCILQN